MNKRYRVTLTPEERDDLRRLISRGKADARKLAHARILLQAGRRGRGWTGAGGHGDRLGAGGERAHDRAGAAA